MFTAEIKIDNLSWRQLAHAQDRHHRLAFFPVERAGQQSLAAKCDLQIGVGFDLAGELVVNAKSRTEPRDWIGLDQLFKNLCACAQARFNLRERVFAIRSLNDEISDTLQQRQKRDQKEEEPSSETAETKFQRYPPVDDGGALFARKSGFKSKVKRNSFDPSARSTCCARFSGEPFSDGCQTSMEYGPAGRSFRIAPPSLPVT